MVGAFTREENEYAPASRVSAEGNAARDLGNLLMVVMFVAEMGLRTGAAFTREPGGLKPQTHICHNRTAGSRRPSDPRFRTHHSVAPARASMERG